MSKKDLESWVTEVAKLVAPEKIHWCDGSEEEKGLDSRNVKNRRSIKIK